MFGTKCRLPLWSRIVIRTSLKRPLAVTDGSGAYDVPGLPAGRYPYHCGIHPIMRGQLVVTDDPSTPSQL